MVVMLMAVMLSACGSGGGGGSSQDGALPTTPGAELVSVAPSSVSTNTLVTTSPARVSEPTTSLPATSLESTSLPATSLESTSLPATSLESTSPFSWGSWESFNQGEFRVEETMWSDTSSHWRVHGTPSGSVDNLPQGSDGVSFEYTGSVWGRVYEGMTGSETLSNADLDDGDRVRGEMRAVYATRDRYVYNDDYLSISLWNMYKQLPNGDKTSVPGIRFKGDVGTDRYAPGYDPALDIATFTLPVHQYSFTSGREQGEAVGSFYGPNGEALAGTFWYRRGGHRIEGAFGGKR